MFRIKRLFSKKQGICVLALLTAGLFSACAGEQEKIEIDPVEVITVDEEEDGKEAVSDANDGAQTGVSPEETGNGAVDSETEEKEKTSAIEALKEQYGEDCLTDQIFEIELTVNGEKVMFVPHWSQSDGTFYMQIIRNGEVLSEWSGYVPDALQGKTFVSLDAVSFFDVNFDGITDIVMVETYGDKTFAAVYFGDSFMAEMCDWYFQEKRGLSERLTESLDEVTISGIRNLLSGGKKNGEFSCYQEAYEAVIAQRELENPGPTEYSKGMQYDLIDFDGDDIPELAAGINGYYMSLYTYSEGSVYALMYDWGYGAMGNAGYEYSPGKNSLRNYNADYAGLVMYLTYMTIGQQHSLEQVVQIVIYNFDDVNGNGMPDEAEQDSFGEYGVNKIDGRVVTEEECGVYDVGGYEYIEGSMSADELLEKLKQ